MTCVTKLTGLYLASTDIDCLVPNDRMTGNHGLEKICKEAATTPSGPGPLITEVSRSHSDTPQSVVLLWTGDQPGAETPT